jgi:hypothetical protein
VLAAIGVAAGLRDEPATQAIAVAKPKHLIQTGPVGRDEGFLKEFRAYSARIHGEERERPPPVLESVAPTLLPLGAYRATLWVRDPTGPDHVTLKSKDPAQPDSYLLVEGETRRGLLLAGVEEMGDEVRFFVHRGAEQHVFELRARGASDRGPIHDLPARAAPSSRGAEHLAAIRVVPFQGPSSRALRVTGVRKGSPFHAAGIRAGDVLVAAGEVPLRTVGDLREVMADGSGHATISLQASDGTSPRSVRVSTP